VANGLWISFHLKLNMKLFLGIEIPKEIKCKISEFVSPIQMTSKGWEQPSDYHLTLLFFGETSEEKLAEIKNRIEHFSNRPFELETAPFQFFSRRILFLSFRPSNDLLELKKLIDKIFPEWIRPNEKAFIPHLTIKRWQRYEFDYLEAAIRERELQPMKFKVSELAIFKSERDFENNKYHVIHRVQFSERMLLNYRKN
jgi:2'-5' RNA ligase